MATTLATTAQNIVNDAYTLIGAKDLETAITAAELEFGLRMLNNLIKQYQMRGVQLHTIADLTIPLGASNQSYTIGPDASYDLNTARPIRIISARRQDSDGNEIPLLVISREDYKRLPAKDTVGTITQVAYERLADYGVVYVWPVNDEALISSTETLLLSVQRDIDVFDNSEDTGDFPPDKHMALTYGLAAILIDVLPNGGSGRVQAIKVQAAELLNMALITDQEPVSLFIQPDRRR